MFTVKVTGTSGQLPEREDLTDISGSGEYMGVILSHRVVRVDMGGGTGRGVVEY